MQFSITTIMALLAIGAIANPIPQIGGEAQACQGVVSGVTGAVGGGTSAALGKVAGNVGTVKGATKFRFFRRQGSGAAAACYDVVNNVDQGTGYAAQNVQAGAVGNTGGECTGNCAVGNAKRQVADISNGVQGVSNAAGTGAATSGVTGAVSGAANTVDSTETSAGATAGTEEADIPADTGATVGNTVYSATGGATGGKAVSGSSSAATNSGSQAPPPKGHPRRQLNKIAAGTQDVANAYGVGNEVAPVVAAEDNVDGIGTGGVGNAGHTVGNTIQNAGVTAGNAVP